MTPVLSPEIVQALLDLQELDLKLLEYEKHEEALPSLIAEIEAPVTAVRGERVRLETELREAQSQQRYYEMELEASNVKFRKLQTQQMHVRNQIEYNAFIHEMDALKERADSLEEAGIRWIERAEAAQTQLPEVGERLAEEEKKATAARAELDRKTAELRRIHEEAASRRAPIVERIPPNVLSYYERLRGSGRAPFVSLVNRGACSGCGFRHPPQRLQEIKQGRQLIACEQCGRIQAWREEQEEQVGF